MIKFVDLTFIDEPLSIVKFVREKMLVMGIAEPHKSRKYEVAVCVAGITTQDKFSRSNIDFPSYHVQAQMYGVLLEKMGFDTSRLF